MHRDALGEGRRYVTPSMDGMYAMPPERAGCHSVYTLWWSQGGISQSIADCGQCGYVLAIWPTTNRRTYC